MSTKVNVYKNSSKLTYDITPEKRAQYRETSKKSRLAKLDAELGKTKSIHKVNKPKLDPNTLMPKKRSNDLTCISLFSGGVS